MVRGIRSYHVQIIEKKLSVMCSIYRDQARLKILREKDRVVVPCITMRENGINVLRLV